MSLFFFFKKAEILAQVHENPPTPMYHPLPLSLSPKNIGFWSLRAKTLCMCVLRYWRGLGGGGGGVGLSRTCLKPCFPTCGKKHRDIFLWIMSNLENRYEIVTWGWLARTRSIPILPSNSPVNPCEWWNPHPFHRWRHSKPRQAMTSRESMWSL